MAHTIKNKNKFRSPNKRVNPPKIMNIRHFLAAIRIQKNPKNIYFLKDLDTNAEPVPIVSFIKTIGSFIASNKLEKLKKPILTDYVISEIHAQLKKEDHRLMDIPVSVFLQVDDANQYWKEYGLIRVIKQPDNLILIGAEIPKLLEK